MSAAKEISMKKPSGPTPFEQRMQAITANFTSEVVAAVRAAIPGMVRQLAVEAGYKLVPAKVAQKKKQSPKKVAASSAPRRTQAQSAEDRALIVEYIRMHPGVTSVVIQRAFPGIHRNSIAYTLECLRGDPAIRTEGARKETRYFLANKVKKK